MANDKKFVVKNGLTSQNISFVDNIDSPSVTIQASVSGNTLSFSGTAGQLFSITDSGSGTIFSVNDISGIPSIEVDDDGTIRLAEFAGNVLIGTATDNGTDALQVDGSGLFTAGDLTYGVSATPSLTLGVNTTAAGAIKLWGETSGTYSLIQSTTNNLHIDSIGGGTYLNFYDGNAVLFGTGASGVAAVMGPDGDLWKGSADNTGERYFHDGYHPNADKWTTARTLSLTGAVTGSVSLDGSGNVSITTTATSDPTLTINGDASGSATFTNLGNATLTLTIADDSHTHDTRYLRRDWTGTIDVNAANGTQLFLGSTASWTNRGPAADNSGALLSLNTHAGNYYSQLWFDTGAGGIYHRKSSNALPTGTWQRLFAEDYHPNADTWTTSRTHTVTLTGDATGTAAVSVNGSANWTNSIAVTVDKIDGVNFRNTGSNAGVNADTLDQNGHTYYTSGVTNFSGNSTDGALYSQVYSSSWQHQIAGDYRSGQIAIRGKNNGTWQSWYKVWSENNDGSGSGLDADLLDGIHASSFLRSDANDTATGIITFRNSSDYQIELNGNSTTYAGIKWVDANGNDYMWFNGSTGTFAIGGGGSAVTGKKLHVDGGLSVGANADSTAMPTNGIYSEGGITVGRVHRPAAHWSASGTTTGCVLIALPDTGTDYDMINVHIDVYEYNSTAGTQIVVSGHNWTTGWANAGVQVFGFYNKPIYLARDGNKYYIQLGNTTSTWSYGSVHVTKVTEASFYNVQDWGLGWSITQATTEPSYAQKSGDYNTTSSTTLKTSGVFVGQGIGYVSNNQRIFADNYHPNADKWTTARTLSLTGDVTGSVSWDGSGNASMTTAVGNDSHTHNYLIAVDDRDMKPNTSGIGGSLAMRAFFSSFGGMTGTADTNYHDVLVLDTYSDSSGGGPNAITFDKGNSAGNPEAYLWKGDFNGTTWGTGQRIFADNYHPTADNADTVDSLHASSFFRADTSNAVDVRFTSGDGRGMRFWDSDSYKIWMSSTGNTTYGGRVSGETTSDYNMYFRMAGGTNRGFVFESAYATKLLSINPNGVWSPLTINAATFNATSTTNGGFQGIDADSLTTPSFTWTADLNTGMYRYAADTIGFSAGGNDEFRIYTSYTLSPGSSRAPVFYDSDDTAYYLSPATAISNGSATAGSRVKDLRFDSLWQSIPAHSGPILTYTLTSGGSGYTDGSYTNQVLSGGNGVYATFDFTVSGGVVTVATLTERGSAFQVGNTITIPALGGTGSGGVITVNTVRSVDLSLYNTASRIRLASSDTSLASGQEIGGIYFNARDASAGGGGDKAYILGVAEGTSGGGKIQFWTSANGGSATLCAEVGGSNDFRLYNTAGTFYHAFSNSPTANRTVTLPDVTGTVLVTSGTTNTAGYFNTGTTTPSGSTRLNYSGYFYPTFLNLVGSSDTTTAATHYFVETGTDGFVRPKTLANVRTEIVTSAAVTSAIATSSVTTTGTITAATFNATSTTNGGFQGIDADTVTAPSFTWTSDLNTGIYRPAADQVGITCGGTNELTITTTTATFAGDVVSNSDIRLKKDIEKIDFALSKVKALNGVNFTKIKNDDRSTGLIAQDVQAVLPEAVTADDNGYLSVAYGNMVGLLVEAIKEQDNTINTMRDEIDDLKKLVKQLMETR